MRIRSRAAHQTSLSDATLGNTAVAVIRRTCRMRAPRMRSSRQLEGNGLAVTLGRITRPQPRDLGVNERAWQGRGGPCLSTAQHAKRSAASDASSISLSAGASPRPGLVEGPVRLRARSLPSARRRTTARNQVELARPDIAVNRTDVLFLENSRP